MPYKIFCPCAWYNGQSLRWKQLNWVLVYTSLEDVIVPIYHQNKFVWLTRNLFIWALISAAICCLRSRIWTKGNWLNLPGKWLPLLFGAQNVVQADSRCDSSFLEVRRILCLKHSAAIGFKTRWTKYYSLAMSQFLCHYLEAKGMDNWFDQFIRSIMAWKANILKFEAKADWIVRDEKMSQHIYVTANLYGEIDANIWLVGDES